MWLTTVLSQTPCEGGENVVLPAANHGYTILFVPHVAQFVYSLLRGSGLNALLGYHSMKEGGDILHHRWTAVQWSLWG